TCSFYIFRQILVSIFFCYSLYITFYPLNLHSFPTRRSSDLDNGTSSPRWRSCVGNRKRASLGTIHRAGQANAERLRRELQRAPADRKSTRLNSSHVKISYAVFCLKKKKQMCKI